MQIFASRRAPHYKFSKNYKMNADFQRLAALAQTDKVRHGYQRFYPREVEEFRYMDFTMIEIGFGQGASLQLWKNYFPRANIVILDIDGGMRDERTVVYKVDQGNLQELRNFTSMFSAIPSTPVCFINDDGSHVPEHQLQTFDIFFSRLLIPGGVYIIEDVETSYWNETNGDNVYFKYGLYNKTSIVEKFKLLADYCNKTYMSPQDRALLDEKTNFVSPDTKTNILSISFQQNCIIVRKKDPSRDYAFDEKMYIVKGIPREWARCAQDFS